MFIATPGEEDGPPPRRSHTHLFTVRVWAEALGDGRVEWRGQIQYIPTGKTRAFRDWDTLIDFVTTTLAHRAAQPEA